MSVNVIIQAVVGLFFAVGFGLLGAFMLYRYFKYGAGSKSQEQTAESENWSATEGQVLQSEVKSQKHRMGHNSYYAKYVPDVVYRYSVGGTVYQSSQIMFANEAYNGTKVWATKEAKRFVVGSSMTVYYDPTNPANAVLERRSSLDAGGTTSRSLVFVFIAAAGGFLLIAACSFLFSVWVVVSSLLFR